LDLPGLRRIGQQDYLLRRNELRITVSSRIHYSNASETLSSRFIAFGWFVVSLTKQILHEYFPPSSSPIHLTLIIGRERN